MHHLWMCEDGQATTTVVTSPSLTMSAVSSNFRAHLRMHSWKSAISLSYWVCAFQPWARLYRLGRELSPTQPSLRSQTAIMITCSDSSGLGSGMPNHYVGDLLLTIGMSVLSRVRTELVQLAIVPALAPHPVQMHRQLAGHRYLRDLPSSPHGKMEEAAAPVGLAAYRNLRRLHLIFMSIGGPQAHANSLGVRVLSCSTQLRVDPMPPRITQKSHRPRASHRMMVGT